MYLSTLRNYVEAVGGDLGSSSFVFRTKSRSNSYGWVTYPGNKTQKEYRSSTHGTPEMSARLALPSYREGSERACCSVGYSIRRGIDAECGRSSNRTMAAPKTKTAEPPNRVVTAEQRDEDALEASLRPRRLAEFIGQKQARENLTVFIEAAKKRNEPLDHVLFSGPPGLGKTTLAQIVAKELGVGFRATSGPVLVRAGDLAALLTNLEARDVLFIDEIHRLNPVVEEILYPAMEDFELDLIIGEGPSARSVKIGLQPFTLIGATTRTGLLTTPLRDRFGIPIRLSFYDTDELIQIVARGARVLGLPLTADGAREIAMRSRGTPRIAARLLKRVRDFAAVAGRVEVDQVVADAALARLEVDQKGLDAFDRRYLALIAEAFTGGPVGVETLAAALGEPSDAIEEIVEPYLIQQGLVQRTPRGRMLTGKAFAHLGLPQTGTATQQAHLFGDEE